MIPLFEGEVSGFTFIDGRNSYRFHRFGESYGKYGVREDKGTVLTTLL